MAENNPNQNIYKPDNAINNNMNPGNPKGLPDESFFNSKVNTAQIRRKIYKPYMVNINHNWIIKWKAYSE
jgi:hypothetical protein